jgi:CheY-like chemotaxis protein
MRLLIVEDEPFIAADLESLTRELGHEVVGVADSKAMALDLARSAAPDGAFLDLKLRDGFTGAEIARVLADDFHLPFAFVTGNAEQLPVGAYGAVLVIAKPFTDHQVKDALAALGRKAA